jgi:hypothetical protein
MRAFDSDVAWLQVSHSLSICLPNAAQVSQRHLYLYVFLQDVCKQFPHCSSDMEPGQAVS